MTTSSRRRCCWSTAARASDPRTGLRASLVAAAAGAETFEKGARGHVLVLCHGRGSRSALAPRTSRGVSPPSQRGFFSSPTCWNVRGKRGGSIYADLVLADAVARLQVALHGMPGARVADHINLPQPRIQCCQTMKLGGHGAVLPKRIVLQPLDGLVDVAAADREARKKLKPRRTDSRCPPARPTSAPRAAPCAPPVASATPPTTP